MLLFFAPRFRPQSDTDRQAGFLRTAQSHFHPKPTDIFVTPDTIRRSFLREGSFIEGPTQPPHRGTSPQLKAVEKVNGMTFDEYGAIKAVNWSSLAALLCCAKLYDWRAHHGREGTRSAKPSSRRSNSGWRNSTFSWVTAGSSASNSRNHDVVAIQ